MVHGQYKNPNTVDGRTAMVHLFEWPWAAIANECETFLGPYGFGGVQISPPYEHRVIFSPEWDTDVKRPWYEAYQPISYKLHSRRGTREDLIDMVQRCNNVGVRIYADVVFNHMCGGDAGVNYGTAGSYADAGNYNFPGVPYTRDQFNVPKGTCPSGDGVVNNYQDANNVRNCNLVGLLDLDTSLESVQQSAADYLNDLINIGVAGFRVDTAKHMWPNHIQAVMAKLDNLNTTFFPANTRPFIALEVIDQNSGEAVTAHEYSSFARVTDFIYGSTVSEVFRDGGSNQIANMQSFGSWGVKLSDPDGLVFIDNHDNQRGHGGGGRLLTHKDPKYYKLAVAYMLSWPHGFPRVMSSYSFSLDWEGPPHDGEFNIILPTFNSDETCSGNWICEHRWRVIRHMIQWRNVAGNEPVQNWWSNGYQQAAYSRGNKAFIALNRDYSPININLYTGLPDGTYCNLARSDFNPTTGACSGETATVSGGYASVYVDNNSDDPLFIIHVEAMVGGSGTTPTTTQSGGSTTTTGAPVEGYARTVIFIHKSTVSGQDLFIRGGIDHNQRGGCTSYSDTSACALPIVHRIEGTNDKFNRWKSGDDYLDWYGPEDDQEADADGTPMVWTTNDPGYSAIVDNDGYGYSDMNKWGEHYWLVDVNMDCSKTEDGWFELKAFLKGGEGWESDRNQMGSCGGSAGGSKPYTSGNHFARCGYINKFTFNGNDCQIDNFT